MTNVQHNITKTAQPLLRDGRVRAVVSSSRAGCSTTMTFVDYSWHGDSGG
ncbi:MAG: hypothetical protein AAGG11_05685 [Pseudomonadota bacterium]